VDDIREHGLHEPIVVYEDKILDGRNRYRACAVAGIEPTFTVYTGDEAEARICSTSANAALLAPGKFKSMALRAGQCG